jgi:hypothetical protein
LHVSKSHEANQGLAQVQGALHSRASLFWGLKKKLHGSRSLKKIKKLHGSRSLKNKDVDLKIKIVVDFNLKFYWCSTMLQKKS